MAEPPHSSLIDQLQRLPDDELLCRLSDSLRRSRSAEAEVVAHFTRHATPSMFADCTEVLHMSEHEAYLRITVRERRASGRSS